MEENYIISLVVFFLFGFVLFKKDSKNPSYTDKNLRPSSVKKSVSNVSGVARYLQNKQGDILLEQRPPLGIWGGLWSFPELPEDKDALTHCQQHHGNISTSEPGKPFRHTFSHYHLDIHPVLMQVEKAKLKVASNDQQRWLAQDAWRQLGLAAPVKKLLESLRSSEQARQNLV